MAREFAPHGIQFVFLYTREAHPGENFPAHRSLEQKIENARDMILRCEIERPMLVDDLQGTVHDAYGRLPNMTYIVGAGGAILYRASWTDPVTIRIALERLIADAAERARQTTLTPYYLEWSPQRVNARLPFLENLLTIAGPRAVEEFIAGMAGAYGETQTAPLRRWWETRRGETREI